ncbi:unnamed protein product, partial [Leptidea sinapis]
MNTPTSSDEKLPDGWVLCASKSTPGRNYYFNRKTGKSSWTPPQESNEMEEKSNTKEKHKMMMDGINKQLKSLKRKKKTKAICSVPDTSKKLKKNLANARLSQLRAQLNDEAEAEETSNTNNHNQQFVNSKPPQPNQKPGEEVKTKQHLNTSPNKYQRRNPSVSPSKTDESPPSDSKSNHSQFSETLHSIPSPSQFFAANKIISSMKAQLPEEFCNKQTSKDTFADIEKEICSQTTDYPFSKHPATPPQFSEASKLVSAIKSKLAYRVSTPKDVKTFSSPKERMEELRTRLSKDVKLSAPLTNIQNQKGVVLVFDTNIFIHDLDLIRTNEMRAKYNHLWRNVIFKEPPWSLEDVLQCLLKHWIAVFSEVFPRIEQLINDLKHTLVSIQSKDPKTVTHSEVMSFKELCLDVAQKCRIIPEYMEMAKQCVGRISSESETASPDRSNSASGADLKNTGDNKRIETTAKDNGSKRAKLAKRLDEHASSHKNEETHSDMQIVVEAFDAKIASAMGVEHSIEDSLHSNDELDALTDRLTTFSSNIDAVANAINKVLSSKDCQSLDESVTDLEARFREALTYIGVETGIHKQPLR